MKKLPLLTTLISSLLLFSACSSIEAPKGSSKAYSTYRLYKEMPSGNANFANREDEVHQILQQELHTVFDQNGLQEAGQDAQLIVTYLVVLQNNAVTTGISDYYSNSGSEILRYAHQKVAIDKDLPSSFEAGSPSR